MKADSAPGRPAWTDAQISEALDVDPKTVAHLRQTVVEDGWAVALHGRSTRNRRRRGVDGKCEARLIAALCGPVPDGYARWSLRLLAAQAVELRALIALLPKSARPDLTPAEQHLFTRYATVTRYPGDYEPIPLSEARAAVKVARRVRHQIRAWLPKPALKQG